MDNTSNTPVISGSTNPENIDDGRFLYKIPEFLDTELTLLTRFTATINVWASCILLLISAVLYITAFSIVEWGIVTVISSGDVIKYGLWQVCDDNGCRSLVTEQDTTGEYKACQGLAVMCMICLFLSVLPLVIYCAFHELQEIRTLRILALLSRTFTAIFLLVTFVLYKNTWYKPLYDNAQHETRLSHSYKLTIASFSFEVIAVLFLFMATRSKALEVRLKKQQAWQEAREKAMAYAYADGGEDTYDENYTVQMREKTASPFEAFKRYSGLQYGENAEVQMSYATANQAYIHDESRTHNSSYTELQNRPSHVHNVTAEINTAPKLEQRQNSPYPPISQVPYKGSTRSYENVPDGSSQPSTPVTERQQRARKSADISGYIGYGKQPVEQIHGHNVQTHKQHGSNQQQSEEFSNMPRPPKRRSKRKPKQNMEHSNKSSHSTKLSQQNHNNTSQCHEDSRNKQVNSISTHDPINDKLGARPKQYVVNHNPTYGYNREAPPSTKYQAQKHDQRTSEQRIRAFHEKPIHRSQGNSKQTGGVNSRQSSGVVFNSLNTNDTAV